MRVTARTLCAVSEVNTRLTPKGCFTMSEIDNTPATTTGTGAGNGDDGQNQDDDSNVDGNEGRLQKLNGKLPEGDSLVGAAGIIPSAAFLIVLTLLLLFGITQLWPVCDFTDPGGNANAPGDESNNANQSAAPTANANSSATSGANANRVNNTNAAPNTNNGALNNTNANTAGQTNPNASGNTSTTSTGTGQPPAANVNTATLDADNVEPNSGPTTGNTSVVINGKNFGTSTDDIKVKFGERKAAVIEVNNESINVRTPKHGQGVVDVSVEKSNGEKEMLRAKYTYVCPAPSGTGLFYMLIMAGALGGCIHAMRSLYWYSGQGELKWRWLLMYFTLPFIGAAMAMIFSLLITAGFVNNTTGSSQALFIIAAAGLVGMFSQQAALKLTDVANAFFTKPGEGKDSEPQKSISVGEGRTTKPTPLTVTAIDKSAGKAAGGDEVNIKGSGFSTSTTVTFGGVAVAGIKSLSPTSLTVVTPAHAAGDVEVEVISGDQTVKLPDRFKYT
jgi:IPT/TIG domain